MTTATATTMGELFAAAVAEYEHEPAIRTPDGTVDWTWGEYGRQAAGETLESAEPDRRDKEREHQGARNGDRRRRGYRAPYHRRQQEQHGRIGAPLAAVGQHPE